MADAAMEPEKKDALLSQGAHEVRNAVSPILGYARMLSSERLGSLTEAQMKAAVEIGNSAKKLGILAEEMSQLARLVAGGTTLAGTRVELASLIAAAAGSVRPTLDGRISIRLIDDAPSAAVRGDARRLSQALEGLIFAHGRELSATDELCIALERVAGSDRPMIRVTIGGADRFAEVRRLPPSELEPQVEVRGGVGFKLSIAGQIIQLHGGRSLSKTEPGPSPDSQPTLIGVVILLPEL